MGKVRKCLTCINYKFLSYQNNDLGYLTTGGFYYCDKDKRPKSCKIYEQKTKK